MSLSNLHSITFTPEELEKLNMASALLQEVMEDKAINLTSDDRIKYSRARNKNQLIINKVMDIEKSNPEHHPQHLDFEEFESDFEARKVLNENLNNMRKYTEMLFDTKILLDYDNYNYAIQYYRYIKLLSKNEVPGITAIYESLKELYANRIGAITKYRTQQKQINSEEE